MFGPGYTSQDEIAAALVPGAHAECVCDIWEGLEFTQTLEFSSGCLGLLVGSSATVQVVRTDRVQERDNQGAVAGYFEEGRVWHCDVLGSWNN